MKGDECLYVYASLAQGSNAPSSLQVSEQDSLTSIAEEHGIPHRHLMALQRNNKALHHSVILQRFCSATEDSRCLW